MRTNSVLARVRGTLKAKVRTSGLRRRNRENQERVVLSPLAEVGVVGGRGDSGPVENGLSGPLDVAADGGDTVSQVSRDHGAFTNYKLTLFRILLSAEPFAKSLAFTTHREFTTR